MCLQFFRHFALLEIQKESQGIDVSLTQVYHKTALDASLALLFGPSDGIQLNVFQGVPIVV
jgi:hypothetical protein